MLIFSRALWVLTYKTISKAVRISQKVKYTFITPVKQVILMLFVTISNPPQGSYPGAYFLLYFEI